MNHSSFLMCPPDYFEKPYRITPWECCRQTIDFKKAFRQWQACYDLLTGKLKAKVELLVPQRGLPNMVLTAHAGIVYKRLFVRSSFRYRERVGEEQHFETWFRKKGYLVKTLPRPFCFDGAGNAIFSGRFFYAGFRFHSDWEAYEIVGGYLKLPFYELRICHEKFSFLEQCCAILNPETVLAYLPAFEPYTRCLLLDNTPDLINVSSAEANRLACSAIVMGQNVIVPQGCLKVRRELEKRKFHVYALDFSEFIKIGAGAKSLVLRIQ